MSEKHDEPNADYEHLAAAWDELHVRLTRAADDLRGLANGRVPQAEFVRLRAKESGVRLALSYMRLSLRARSPAAGNGSERASAGSDGAP